MEKNQPKFEKETDKYYNLELEMRNFAFIEEVEQVECQSCGLKEECTIVYITQVQECYCGKWVCGLFSKAVKERVRGSSPKVSMHDALSSHRDLCQKYNCIRLNPKLFLTLSMREIVKKSLENKKSI
ncbi:hypothetical protein Lalb_Chr16g0389131 [Lupinus albus]|uniref:Uncharacterized protein n=1 Tax=Lupinus albus TaxID=3870 RepID=A0A6A4PDK2_LUPAL|nr:hypothetical protein Lalb_Chr16g0389131 [Lupinus albus]